MRRRMMFESSTISSLKARGSAGRMWQVAFMRQATAVIRIFDAPAARS